MGEDNSLAALEYEIAAEKAASLGRAAARLEQTLAALAAFDAAAPTPVTGGPRLDREPLVIDAAERLWFYIVQREALGWHRHDDVYTVYQVPEEIIARMGPRPAGSAPVRAPVEDRITDIGRAIRARSGDRSAR